MKKLLHIAKGKARMPLTDPFVDALREVGELQIIEDGADLPVQEQLHLMRECNLLLTMWGSLAVPKELAKEPGKLEYICNVTGEMPWIPVEIIESDLPVTNWGTAPANQVAEALLLTTMKNIHAFVQRIEDNHWGLGEMT